MNKIVVSFFVNQFHLFICLKKKNFFPLIEKVEVHIAWAAVVKFIVRIKWHAFEN